MGLVNQARHGHSGRPKSKKGGSESRRFGQHFGVNFEDRLDAKMMRVAPGNICSRNAPAHSKSRRAASVGQEECGIYDRAVD